MKEHTRIGTALAIVLTSVVVAGCNLTRGGAGTSAIPAFRGAPSVDALLDEFVAALAARDIAALHHLRVTESEYRYVIIPGSVPVGRTADKTVSDTKFQFFWGMLNGKSRDYGKVIMNDFGGHPWRRKRHWFTQPERQLAGYKGLGEVRIAVEDDAGNTGTVRTGWIAEVDGRFKFIGFEYDDD